MKVNMSSLASLLLSEGLYAWGTSQNYRLCDEMRTLQRMSIVLTHILTSLKKVYCLTIFRESCFLQDNVRIHIANVTRVRLESHEIWVAEYPVHSLDLNPIEHIWKAL